MRSLTLLMTCVVLAGCSGTSDLSTEDTKSVNAPSNLVATRVGRTAVQLAWTDNSDNEDSFVVERKASGSDFYPAVFVLTNVTTAVDSNNIRTDSTYQYRVRAIKYINSSSFSNTVSQTFSLPYP